MKLIDLNQLPFIETDQYVNFAYICDDTTEHQAISLIWGMTGVGKTTAALRYCATHRSPTHTELSSVLYVPLNPAIKTVTQLYSFLYGMTTKTPPRPRSAAIALTETIRVLREHRYEALYQGSVKVRLKLKFRLGINVS